MNRAAHKPTSARPEPLCVAVAAICHRRWTIPVLAELKQARGCKFVTLVNRLGVSRPLLTQTLDFLVRARLVERNPGYGHPMRPEYILTDKGASAGRAALAVRSVLQEVGAEDAGLRKWSLAVVIAIGATPKRFGELRETLAGISDRALSLTLRDLVDSGVVERVELARPTAEYTITPDAKALLGAARRFGATLAGV